MLKGCTKKSLVMIFDVLLKTIQIQISTENVSGCDSTQTY